MSAQCSNRLIGQGIPFERIRRVRPKLGIWLVH